MNRANKDVKVQELLRELNKGSSGKVFKSFTPKELLQLVQWTVKYRFETQNVVAHVRNGQYIKAAKLLTLDDIQEAYDLAAIKEVIES
jgi:hypothetical protein